MSEELVGEAGDGGDDGAVGDVDYGDTRREDVIHVCCLAVGAEEDFAWSWGGFDAADDASCHAVDDVDEGGPSTCNPYCAVVGGEECFVRGSIGVCLRHDTVVEGFNYVDGVT